MPTTMLKYYFLKDLLDKLPDGIKEPKSINKNVIFDATSLIDVGSFYLMFNPFKKDKYNLRNKFNSDSFNIFIYDAILNFKNNPSEEKLIVIYALVSSYILNKNIDPYINANLGKHSYFDATNMIDFYYAKLKGIDLSKIDLTYEFIDGFKYHNYTDELIKNPSIKAFNFLLPKPYFTKAYKDMWIYYSYFTKSRFKIKLFGLKVYDFLFNHRKGKTKLAKSIISNKIDTTILNITKKKYIINDKEYFNSLDEIIAKAYNEAFSALTIINNYLFYNLELEFNNYFKVPSKKELKKLEEK